MKRFDEFVSEHQCKDGYVLTQATETDQPQTEVVISNLLPSHQAAIKLAQQIAASGIVARVQPIKNKEHQPISHQGLWEQMIVEVGA